MSGPTQEKKKLKRFLIILIIVHFIVIVWAVFPGIKGLLNNESVKFDTIRAITFSTILVTLWVIIIIRQRIFLRAIRGYRFRPNLGEVLIFVGILLWIILWFLWQVPKQQVLNLNISDATKAAELVDKYRATWAQIVGGFGAFIGLIFIAWRVLIAEENTRINLESQITDRFTKATEQLGSDKLAVRLGGIYSLERIGNDSFKDQVAVIEILSAFVREKIPNNKSDNNSESSVESKRDKIPQDIVTIFNVLGRYKHFFGDSFHHIVIDLKFTSLQYLKLIDLDYLRVDFSGANLEGAHFIKVSLYGSKFINSNMRAVRFENLLLEKSNLSGAILREAILFKSYLGHSKLINADLTNADLRKVNFESADLKGTILTNAILEDTDLRGVNLFETKNLTMEQINSARINEKTILPKDLLKN